MQALPESGRSADRRHRTGMLFGIAILMVFVLAGNPVYAQGGLEAGISAFERGEYGEAETLLRSLVETNEENHAALYHLGRTCLALWQKKEAVELLERAVELAPGEVMYHKWLARAYNSYAMQLGQIRAIGLTKKIIREFETIIELDPGAASERRNLVMIYYFLPGLFGGDKDRAFELIGEQRRIDPREGAYTMAELQIEIGNDDEAMQECRNYLRTSPGDIMMRNQLGRVYHAMERWEDAFGVFEEVIRDAPDDYYAYYLLGRSAGTSGMNLERGVECLQFYIGHTGLDEEELPSHADAHWRLGLIREKQGDIETARTEYERALELDPDHPYAKSAIKRIRRR